MYEETINDSFETVAALLRTTYNLEQEARRYRHNIKREEELLSIATQARECAKEIYESVIRCLANVPKK